MANLALIRGEADVAPKFLDVGKAFSEPFANVVGKAVEFREQQKAIVKRENEIRAQEYASIDTVDVSQIGEDLLGATTVEANNIKNKAFELIKSKSDMDPVEYSIALSNLKKDVADLNANIKIKKLLGTDYADADKIGQAPWLDANNKAALLAAIDTNVKKDWVKKDGKYFLTTDGGKTLIDLSNIKPPETIDYGIGVAIENSTQQMLQNKYKLGQTLTDQNVIDTADLQIRSMNPSQIKSAALHFNVAGNTEESQRDYYNKSLDEITEDVRNAMVSRLKGIQSSLNTKLSQANAPKSGTNEPYVAQVANRIKKAIETEQGTMNESTFIKIANETLSPSAKRSGKLFTDRNEGKVLYVQNALMAQKELDLEPSEKKSKADFEKEFNELYPVGAGNIFLNGNLLDINLSDPRAIGEEVLGQSGVSDFEKFISKYLPPLSIPSIKKAAVEKAALP